MTHNNTLQDRCRVVSNTDGDNFVGIKTDSHKPIVYFPLGFQLSKNNEELRTDILHLFSILKNFKDTKEGFISQRKYKEKDKVEFPINAYLEIILYYIENGYYKEVEPIYKTRDRGKINWPKTIKQQNPLLSQNRIKTTYSPIYTKFTVKLSNLNEDKEITRIHQHCVRESFEKIGWIFTSYMPPKAEGTYNKNRFLAILRYKLSNTNNDVKKRLFQSMIEMINYIDEEPNPNFHFGTYNFEKVWEDLIDRAFGIKNKEDYFPDTEWHLFYTYEPNFKSLEPDTIMIYKEKIYVLDAKYYRYGDSGYPYHLPPTASISKQITYGEYVNEVYNVDPFNAFLMPYNMDDNPFNLNNEYETIGEAISKWKSNEDYTFEHVQGILVDTKYLMNNYTNKKSNILKLAEAIEKSVEKNKILKKESNNI